VPVVISCATKSCSGTLDLVEMVVVKMKTGRKTVTKTETVVVGTTTYKLEPKQKQTAELLLNRTGTALFAQVSRHPLREDVTTTPKGGNATGRSITVS
jgi:hypothetical protein